MFLYRRRVLKFVMCWLKKTKLMLDLLSTLYIITVAKDLRMVLHLRRRWGWCVTVTKVMLLTEHGLKRNTVFSSAGLRQE